MYAGRLDRRITIQSFIMTQDESGQEIQTWATFADVWAQRKDVRGSERFASQQELATRTATFRLRWLAGIDETMRLVDNGTTWNILGVADNARQGWLELSCEAQNAAATQ